jgi:hypothetical protein
MFLDAQLCFNTTAQAITGGAGTSTDYINVSAPIRPDSFRVSTVVSAVGGTTPTLTIELFGDTAATFASEKSCGSRAIAAADLVAGKVYHLDIAPTAPFQFYRVKYAQSGTAPTATVQSFLVDEDLVQTDVLLAGVSTP